MKFIKNPKGSNYIIENSESERISYNNTYDNGPETAYVLGGIYIIKNGDHRKEIEKGKSFKECVDILKNIDAQYSRFSNQKFI